MPRSGSVLRQTVGWLLAGISVMVAGLAADSAWRAATALEVGLHGDFHSVTHKGQGSAQVARDRQGKRWLRLAAGFRTYPDDSLQVCLSPIPDAEDTDSVLQAGMICVGALGHDSNKGRESRFSIPATLDLTRFRTVVIWSERAKVNFTSAPLQKVNEVSSIW